jgi:IS30 family transposase
MKKYLQLGILEREKIQSMLWEGKSIRCIAEALGRSPSSISREIKRNLPEKHYRYTPRLAELRARQKIMERGKRPRLKDEKIQKYVVAKLKEDYSPEQVAGTLKDTYPDLSISHEAIYQFIYAQYHRDGYGTLIGLDLRMHLKRKHKTRRRKLLPFAKETGRMQGIKRISERPQVVQERSRFGDWEGDSMVSRKSPVGLNTLVERKSGYVCISKLKRVGKNETLAAVAARMQQVPEHLKHTLTLDNGPENTSHKQIEETTGLDVYFANPYHSWERGTNENTNGLIRHYLPKGTDFATVHLNTIRAIERKLNNRPRKRLGYKTPQQIFNGVLH